MHGRHRLDHRPLLHRLRAARPRRLVGDLRRGARTIPDAGRPWRIAEELDVNIFHTSPTAIRMLRRADPDEPQKYNYNFKHMTTVGEPIEPEVWRWYYKVVGKREGGHRRHLVADGDRAASSARPCPRSHPMKPGSAGPGAAGHLPGHPRRRGERAPRAGRQGRATSASATRGPASCRRSGATTSGSSGSTTRSYCKDQTARTGTTGRTSPATARSTPPTATSASSAASTTSSTWPATGSAPRSSSRAASRSSRSARPRSCRSDPRSRGASPTSTSRSSRATRRRRRSSEKIVQTMETKIGKIARPRQGVDRLGHAEDEVGQDHAARPGGHLRPRDPGDITTLANPDVVEQIRRMSVERAGSSSQAGAPRPPPQFSVPAGTYSLAGL